MDSFHTMPIGSIYARENISTMDYLDIAQSLPDDVKGMLASVSTASYLRGLARSYDITEGKIPSIAFAVLEISIGKKTFAQLPAILSTELKLPNDKAQTMAAEIEKDVFASIRSKLDSFLRDQKVKSTSVTSKIPPTTIKARPIQNVLNLKELPPKPSSKTLPPAPKTEHPKFPLPPKRPQPSTQPIRFT
jgi:hypothetical protein